MVYYDYNTRSNIQHARLQVTTNPITTARQKSQDLHNTCASLVDLIIIIMHMYKIMQKLVSCNQSQSSVDVTKSMTSHLHVVENTELTRLNDKQIKHLIELWRQEECLWKVMNKNYLDMESRKSAMVKISKEMGGIDTGKDTL